MLAYLRVIKFVQTAICAAAVAAALNAATAFAAIGWQGGGDSNWWFDPQNWSQSANNRIPPVQGETPEATDVQISAGSGDWDLTGEGVVYDPSSNDPFFDDAADLEFPTGFDRQTIWRLYVARNTTTQNLLTIKGDLSIVVNPNPPAGTSNTVNVQIGRSGSTAVNQNLGRVNHEAGRVFVEGNLDIGQREGSGWGNGIWDYRSGILDVQSALRLSHGGGAGTGGHGRLIVHNPDSPGRVRVGSMAVASSQSFNDMDPEGTGPDGDLTGVGIVEFRYQNGGTRPVQVQGNLSINNGATQNLMFARSSRLELVLHEAPAVDAGGVPTDILPLFWVGGNITGEGDLDGDFNFINDRVFSSGDASKDFYERAAWEFFPERDEEDFLLEARFGNTLYRYELSYTGVIDFSNADTSAIASVNADGGNDIVLVGHSSVVLPGLSGDFNEDGVVDAADYTVWRDTGGTPEQYNEWKQGFGDSLGAGASLATASVPEPTAAVLALLGALLAAATRCRRFV